MVFSNSILSQTLDNTADIKKIAPSANEIAFSNKTTGGITMLDITFPDSSKYGDANFNAEHGGLVSNSFHCKIIGEATIGV